MSYAERVPSRFKKYVESEAWKKLDDSLTEITVRLMNEMKGKISEYAEAHNDDRDAFNVAMGLWHSNIAELSGFAMASGIFMIELDEAQSVTYVGQVLVAHVEESQHCSDHHLQRLNNEINPAVN